MIVVSVCLSSDALLQHLPSYLGFSYLGCGVSLHGCSSKAQPLLLTLDEGYLLTPTPSDLERGIAPLGLPAPVQPPLLGVGLLLPAMAPSLWGGVGPPGCRPWPWTLGSSSWPPPLTLDVGKLLLAAAPDLGCGVPPLGCSCAVQPPLLHIHVPLCTENVSSCWSLPSNVFLGN